MKNHITQIHQILKANKLPRFNGQYGYSIKPANDGALRVCDNDLAESIAIDLKNAGYIVRLEVGKTSVLVKVAA